MLCVKLITGDRWSRWITPYRFDIRPLPDGVLAPINRDLCTAVQEIFGTVRGRIKLWGYFQKGFPPEWLAERYR